MRRATRRRFLAGAAALGAVRAPYVFAQSNFLEPARIRMGFAPYISAGPYFIAEAKGYFRKLNIEIVPTSHVDGSLSMPSLVAGELDITGATLSAGLFNLMSKGADLRLFFDRGREAPGWGSNAILVSRDMWERGFRSVDGYKAAKGTKIGISSRGSVAQYLHTMGIDRAGLKVDDFDWQWGLAPKASLPLMQQNRIDILNLPLPGAYAAQHQGIGKIATWSDELAPNFALACSVANRKFLREQHSAVVRFSMAIMQGNIEFMDAAKSGNPEILKIIAEQTGLTVPVIDETRPRWTYMPIDGIPELPQIVKQQKFWRERTDLLARSVPEDQLFDDAAIKEAKRRLDEKNPFK
ncbi:MAG TPA: ABC transporter substrate-binding protein [Sphingomicrobium sp.]|nr:ABC transporter substrate-binding protein [Sphingomicrobium sp.]